MILPHITRFTYFRSVSFLLIGQINAERNCSIYKLLHFLVKFQYRMADAPTKLYSESDGDSYNQEMQMGYGDAEFGSVTEASGYCMLCNCPYSCHA